MTQKTLAHAAGVDAVEPGEVIFPEINLAAGSDNAIPQASRVLEDLDSKQVFNPEKVAVASDHFHLNNSRTALQRNSTVSRFASKFKIAKHDLPGRGGVAHIHNSDSGRVIPGDVVVAADSHACAYGALGAFGMPVGGTDLAMAMTLGKLWIQIPGAIRVTFTGEPSQLVTGKDLGLMMLRELGPTGALGKSIEFAGESLEVFPIGDRFILADMAFECGAINGMMVPHGKALEYLGDKAEREAQYFMADDDAEYEDSIEINAEELEPLIADVERPGTVFGVSALEKSVPVDQVVIGGCGGAQVEDLYLAAKVMKYRQIDENVRLLIIPGSVETYRRLINEGLASIFTELGASIWAPTCGPCPDTAIAELAPGETGVVTTRGRSYQNGSQVYSASVAVAAASAVTGHLTDPRDLIGEIETPTPGADSEFQ
ncbi:MAG: 3-isopropylmalate dehydratase large subunit [Candidatus Marinimicrobia bacterium]|nr:3-isopropylmalate dehydratase large subunit [Candidatus Neomarinimicrobiota bacterium]MCF7827668.1 3-isopropylmalate dehydratase large subunit [Candidatus Neomarinimicrobiota bacterium]MCF7881277.1 3-isopropylmalate dehydratase large subunit [Candidatus Neomarinimicrobiota bacterium]